MRKFFKERPQLISTLVVLLGAPLCLLVGYVADCNGAISHPSGQGSIGLVFAWWLVGLLVVVSGVLLMISIGSIYALIRDFGRWVSNQL